MDSAVRSLIEAVHQRPMRCVLVLTGGGTLAAGWLLTVPGGSRTILEVHTPYAEQALSDYLGRTPEQFCSAATSQDLANRAYDRAAWLGPGERGAGLACTASLVSNRPKRGDHRLHVSIRTADSLTTWSLTLHKGARDRDGEETILDAVILNALAEAVGVNERLRVPLLDGEVLQRADRTPADPLQALYRRTVAIVLAELDGRLRSDPPLPKAVLAGSFNPLHHGHLGLAAVAERVLGMPVAFELSIINADKPALPLEESRRRLEQFTWRAPLYFSRAPTFAEKAAVFPGAVFVVGCDTAARIVAPRFYHDRDDLRDAALELIRSHGCRFLVAGRDGPDGRFHELGDIAIPERYQDLFAGIPEQEFHVPVSSTELRQRVG